jgi:non-ribosomal peptide synthetase component F
MINDARLRLVLTHSGLVQSLSLPAGPTCIALDQTDTSGEPTTAPSIDLDPEHLAYVIYTSGSTGRPKAAPNTHRGLVNRLQWMQHAYLLKEDDAVLQKTPATFDVSVWEFFWPLLTGARLVVGCARRTPRPRPTDRDHTGTGL